MKVVINACYGGFGLSVAGTEAYLARKGKAAYWFTTARDADGRLDFKAPSVPVEHPGEEWFAQVYTSPERTTGTFFDDDDIPRDDPDLIAVVEELGVEANSRYASLKVVEIPDGTRWVIDEYDGYEHVAEEHQVWS